MSMKTGAALIAALVVAGCLASAGLALAADWLLGLIEKGLKTRKRAKVWLGIAASTRRSHRSALRS